jgi:hypothetical protein
MTTTFEGKDFTLVEDIEMILREVALVEKRPLIADIF